MALSSRFPRTTWLKLKNYINGIAASGGPYGALRLERN
jgi:hypothetical protein